MTARAPSGPSRAAAAAPLAIATLAALVAAILFVTEMRRRTGGHLSLPLDDSYIYLQYARRLAEGHVLSYTEGAAPSTGASSWVQMILLSGAFLMGLDGEQAIWASIALSTAYFAAVLWLAYRVTRAIVGGAAGRWWGLGASAVVAFHWTFLLNAFSGMETGLWTAVLLAVVVGLAREGRPPWWSWAVAAAIAWVRPEGLAMGGFAILALFAADRRARVREGAAGFAFRRAVAAGMVALVPLVVGWALTGTLQTDTYAVKGVTAPPPWAGRAEAIAGIPASWQRQALWLFTNFRIPGAQPFPWFEAPYPSAVTQAIFWTVAAGCLYALVAGIRARSIALGALLGFLVLGVLVTSLCAWPHARYAAPYAPLAIVAAASGFAAVARVIRPRALSAAFSAIVALAAAAYVLTPLTPRVLEGYSWNCENNYNQQRKVGEWIRENTAPGTVVGVNDAGAIAYFSDRPIIDLVGLTSHGWAPCVHERPGSVFEKLEALPPERRPDILAIYDEAYPNLLASGVGKELLFAAILEHNTVNASAVKVVCSTDWERPVDRHAPLVAPLERDGRALTVVDAVNVAHLDSERDHGYRIRGRAASIVTALPSGAADGSRVIEGARVVTGSESFSVAVQPGRDVVLIARTAADVGWSAPVAVGGAEAARFECPARAGVWSECVATVPAAMVRGDRLDLTIGADFEPGTSPPPAPRQVAYYWVAQ